MNNTGAGTHVDMRLSLHALALLGLVLLSFALPAKVTAQAPNPPRVEVSDTVKMIRLSDGSVLFGRIVAVEGERITVETTAGARVEIPRAQIRAIEPVRGTIRNGEVWPQDPNTSRLLFGPTGRTIPAGEGYFGIFELVFPYLAFGATDYLTIAGGTPIVPGVIGEVFYLAPKVRVVSTSGAQISAGVLAFFATEAIDEGSFGIAYGVGTFGGADNALTAGVGYAFAGEDLANRPVVSLGGETRLSRRTKLITENYLVFYEEEDFAFDGPSTTRTESVALLSAGLRFIGDRLSADAGLGFAVGQGGQGCCLPVINFIYSFGGR